ncbi:hypothetical protein GEMRC1_011231 [Eukaryota sp. GEM-RC1]
MDYVLPTHLSISATHVSQQIPSLSRIWMSQFRDYASSTEPQSTKYNMSSVCTSCSSILGARTPYMSRVQSLKRTSRRRPRPHRNSKSCGSSIRSQFTLSRAEKQNISKVKPVTSIHRKCVDCQSFLPLKGTPNNYIENKIYEFNARKATEQVQSGSTPDIVIKDANVHRPSKPDVKIVGNRFFSSGESKRKNPKRRQR